jgi:GPN-loop GTPase
MGRFVQLVIGSAGVGKSSYCHVMQEHCKTTKRTLHVANLDPAAEQYEYDCAFDIRDLVNVDEVMDEMGYGPNGGLVYAMEYLFQHNEWLKEQLDQFGEDDYILLDCPGQIELYSHLPVMKDLGQLLLMWGYRVASVYLMDALFILEPSKFISGCMLSLSCMIQLDLPHINVITKCDLADKKNVEIILECEGAKMVNLLDQHTPSKLRTLTKALSGVVDDYMMVSFATLDISDEDSIEAVLSRTDFIVQYGQ